jgi:transposase
MNAAPLKPGPKKRRAEGQLRPVEKFEMRQFREAGMSIRDCATYFNISVATAMRALAEMREKFGAEKLPPTKKHLARSRLAMSQAEIQNGTNT